MFICILVIHLQRFRVKGPTPLKVAQNITIFHNAENTFLEPYYLGVKNPILKNVCIPLQFAVSQNLETFLQLEDLKFIKLMKVNALVSG